MKKAVKFLKQISVIVLILTTVQISAQSTVNGNVKDNNNIPLPGANVIIDGTSTGAVTDFDGNFSFTTNLNPPFTLNVSSIGFEPKTISVSTLAAPINIVLQEGNSLDEIIISASRKREKIQEAPAAVSVLTAKKIEAYATANPIMGLKNLTGVDIAQYGVGDGKINLRGKSTAFQTETFMIADYRNITIPSFGASVAGQNPVDAIDLDRVEVIKGPGSALYGPGVEAGVVHFITKSPFKKQGFTFSLGLGNQKQVQSAFRYATVSKNDKLGFKLTGYMRSAEDFKIDDPEGLARIGDDATQIISSITGEDKGVTEFPDYDVRSYGFTGTLEYRMTDKTTIVGTGGYSTAEGLIRVGQGEGYTRLPRPFAQLRVHSGGFFAQAFWSKQLGGDDTWIYGTGRTQYNDISQYEGQVQYNFDALDDRLDVTIGADYRLNETDSKGSIYGKYEDVDDYTIYGAYLQGKYKASDKLDLIVAGRVDKFEALDATSFSPRFAAVYKHDDDHTFRATFNHSTGAPVALNLFTDLQVGAAVGGSVPVWLSGGAEEFTYNDGNAFLLGGGLGAVPSELPLAGLYQVVAANFAGSPLEGYINSLLPQISGTTSPTVFGEPLERGVLEPSVSNQFEIGYIGRLTDKFRVTVDAYYNKREKNLTATVLSSPFIGYATAGQELHDAIAAVDGSGIILPNGLTIAQTFQAGIEGLTLDDEGNPAIVGFLTADQSPNNVLDVTFFNIESIDYFGVDLGMDYYLNDNVSLFGSVSWLSQNYWEEINILDSEQKVPFSLNVPDLRAKIGIDYLPETGFTANLAARYRSEFESVNGASWTGTNEASTVIDASIGYKFSDNYKLNVSATNIFDSEYRPIANAPFIRRLILAKLTIHID